VVTLRIEGLCFSYDSHPVFTDLSQDIEKGTVVSLVGSNGAGKSTLLQCVNHILKPSAGEVLVAGRSVARMSRIERAAHFAYLPQRSENLFPTTVFETVLTGRFPHSPVRFTRHDEEITARTLSDMELSEFAQRTFDHLSGGEQQQVLIARALAQEARILLLDEPTNNLDLKHQYRILRLVRDIARQKGFTSMLAIHDLNLAAAFSDRVIVLHEGGVFREGRPSEVFTASTIRKVFGVDAKVYLHDGVPHIVVLSS
jgi:iron complex transport system ATP-binding protein